MYYEVLDNLEWIQINNLSRAIDRQPKFNTRLSKGVA